MKPKRKVITRSPHRTVGLVSCGWLQKEVIEYESQLERRFIQRMLLTPGVKRIIDQPFTVTYGEEKDKSYTPDFLVEFFSGRTLIIEVKPEVFVKKWIEIFDQVSSILTQRVLSFHVVTDRMIDQADLPVMIELLLRYARGSVPDQSVEAVQAALRSTAESLSIAAVMQMAQVDKTVVLHMLGRTMLIFHDSISLADDTHIKSISLETDHENICIPSWLDAAAWNPDAGVRAQDRPKPSSVRRPDHSPKLYVGHRQGDESDFQS
ncbi:Tn7 transposase TnsA N-terminal domain-containing protein [Undibacterium sp. RuTC16W]|uniref:Tn7 transposase TnsA N-terminal domain-containing protein n=1 Tax=Undibacterium sp. RuTC16W TaxID=3413048 RepID=UPI003BF3DCBD